MNRSEVEGWVRAEGTRLVNGRGENLLLRGVGLGSWLLPEGYMWKLPEAGDRPRRIERLVEDLIGPDEAAAFWASYRERYVAEADIRRIAEEGFNSVRVPFNARMLLEGETNARGYNETALGWLDRVVEWCRRWKLYVILDMHGAPGGQTGANIDDSERDVPELFVREECRQAAVDMWRMLAERYRNEWIVAGYDLLNEPLPDYHGAYNDQVEPLYRDMIRAIREVDDRHLVILEGVHWATDFSVFTEPLDGNVLYQFHKYWNNPDTESIRRYLDFRDRWNVPVFMGEGGENDLDWYAGAFRLFEDHGVGWNFWTWKKMDTMNSPCSIRRPDGWEELAAYLEGGKCPDRERALRIFGQYLEHLPLEACDYRPEVIRALFRRLPVRIPAVHYGYGKDGFGVAKKCGWTTGYRGGDGVEIRHADDGIPHRPPTEAGWHRWNPDDKLCVQLAPGDWLAYDFTAAAGEAGRYRLRLRMSAPEGAASVEATLDGERIGEARAARADWDTVGLGGELPPLAGGAHRIALTAREAPVRLEALLFHPAEEDAGDAP